MHDHALLRILPPVPLLLHHSPRFGHVIVVVISPQGLQLSDCHVPTGGGVGLCSVKVFVPQYDSQMLSFSLVLEGKCTPTPGVRLLEIWLSHREYCKDKDRKEMQTMCAGGLQICMVALRASQLTPGLLWVPPPPPPLSTHCCSCFNASRPPFSSTLWPPAALHPPPCHSVQVNLQMRQPSPKCC